MDPDAPARALAAAARAGDHAAALAAAESILSPQSPQTAANDDVIIAAQCKAAALLQLERFREAADFCSSRRAGNDGGPVLAFEHAYALYQLKDHAGVQSILDQAIPVAEKENVQDFVRMLHLRAQTRFREGDFAQASRDYEYLRSLSLDTNNGDTNGENAELQANAVAAFVSAGMAADAARVVAELPAELLNRSFDLVYNEACGLIAEQEWDRALVRLQAAEAQARVQLADEGVSSDEIEDEVAAIRCQRAFVLQMQGDDKGAAQIYTELLRQKPSDPVVTAIAANNMVAIHGVHDLFDSAKRLKAATGPETEQKLTAHHRAVIGFNHCLVLMHMNKGDQCRELVGTLKAQHPDMARSARLALVLAALLLKEKRPQEAEAVLASYANDNTGTVPPSEVILVQLARVQASLQRDDTEQAIKILEDVAAGGNAGPAVSATLVALHERRKDINAAERVLNEHVAKLEDAVAKGSASSGLLLPVLRKTADFLISHGRHRSAASTLARVAELAPTDLHALPQLVISLSYFDFQKAESYESRLPPLEEAEEPVSEAELDKLEASRSTGVLRTAASQASKAAVAAAPAISPKVVASDEARKPKKPRKKKIRYPKGYDATTIASAPQPDPERWIPKRERVASRKRLAKNVRKHQVAAAAKGAQGSQDKARAGGVATPEQIAREQDERAAKYEAEVQAAKAARESGSASSPGVASRHAVKKKGGGRRRR